MRRPNPRAAACIDAVHLAGDPNRLQHAPAAALVAAAATLAKGLVAAAESGGLKVQRAAAFDLLDNAGRAIGDELRRRQ